MRLVVTGAAGQVGSDVLRLAELDPRVTGLQGLTRAELDITDGAAVRAVIRDQARAVRGTGLTVVSCAAWTDVDGAEEHEAEAYAVNASGPAHLALACAEVGARLVHVSTDYVFAGDATRPYRPADPAGPRSAYGRTKLAGETAVRELHPWDSFVVRTAWVYGATGTSFVKTMVRLAAERDTISVVDDQRGSPTWSWELARALVELALSPQVPAGTYHLAGAGEATWWELARAVLQEIGADPDRVLPCSSADYPRPAPRPAWSVLDTSDWTAAGLPAPKHWRDALAEAFATIGPALGV